MQPFLGTSDFMGVSPMDEMGQYQTESFFGQIALVDK